MAQLTNLNVSPYYDDFDKTDDFHRVLFRPGFAIQARELTTLQSILQNQIEQHGSHMFKDGTVVIPGQASYSSDYYSLALESTFGGEDINVSQFFNATNPVLLTGATSGVKAQVVGFAAGTTTTQPFLYVQYVQTGDDKVSDRFLDSENISADVTITHTTSYAAAVASATTFSSSAAGVGSAVTVEEGVYFIRGQFVRNSKQTVVLSNTSNTTSKRVGFQITETLVTPENDATLTDNATGSNNFAAKGAHRLKISLTLVAKDIDSTADTDFVELIRTNSGRVTIENRTTDHAILGETLARRTFDESGDYTVRPFQYEVREHLDNDVRGESFTGVYGSGATTDDGGTASEAKLAIAVTPGKAFVRGYEVEKIATTFKDLNKARSFDTINAGITTFEMGNFAFVTNVHNMPDISNITGETTPYKEVKLFTDFTTTRGSSSGYQIGVARARAMEFFSGTQGSTDAQYKLFLFDVRMFTFITLSGAPDPTLIVNHSSGVQIKGVTSGATGFMHSSSYTNVGSDANQFRFPLTNVVGSFVKGEKIIASDSTDTGKIVEGKLTAGGSQVDLTIADTERGGEAIVSHRFEEARQVFGELGTTDFTADLVMALIDDDGKMILDGTDENAIDENSKLTDTDGSSNVGLEPIRVARLIEPEKNVSIFKMPKRPVKTHLTATNSGASDTQFTVRRQFVGTTNSSGAVTFTAGTNETFGAFATTDYMMSIISAGGGTGSAGDVVLLNNSKITGEGGSSITITDNSILGADAKVKVIATITRTSVQPKIKTTNLSKQLKVVAEDADGAFGIRATDDQISLGRADVFKLQTVFDSQSTSSDATAPELTISTIVGTFQRGERITGSSTNARARIIDTSSPMSYVLEDGFGSTDFSTADTITGANSGATATVTAVTAGSEIITSRFTLDTGQRDNFYDIARLVRKPGAAKPLGRLLVVYDYFSHGAGDAFTVDSYTSVAGQMQYDDIPKYSATRTDPDGAEPAGEFQLRNCYDFRPTCEDASGTSTTVSTVDQLSATDSTFNFELRQFDGIGAVTVDMPKPASNIQSDFEFFLPYRASLFLTNVGEFKVLEGVAAEDPVEPKDLDNSLKLASLFVPAFTFSPKDVAVVRYKTQRFTMRDIGRIKDRLETVEAMTALSLLERDAESFEIQDANGLNRFKSGFIVDNFAGHRVGDTVNADYEIAVDPENNELRPKCVLRQTELEVGTTFTAVSGEPVKTASTNGLAKTGDIITLDYTHTTLASQPYATRIENVQPFITAQWVGQIVLSPASDNWFETEFAPDLIINVEGNFDAVLRANQNALGTIWNSWETQWSGVVSTRVSGTFNRNFRNEGDRTTFDVVQRTVQTSRTDLRRTGLHTEVVENVVEESQGNRVISRAMIPFIRPRAVGFVGVGFLPNTRLYPFFDGRDVSSFVTPASGTYTTDTTIVAGSPLITNSAGKIEGTFNIPDYKFRGQRNIPRFRTGEVEFRLTSSSINIRAGVANQKSDASTAGQTTYQAQGILETEQETIIATRNAIVVQTNMSQTTSRTSSTTRDRVIRRDFFDNPQQGDDGNTDPLAQTFISADANGCFLTKIDLFFQAKDNNLPAWVEIRNVINGYPGPKILPFGRKLLDSSEINLSDNGTTATTFHFDSPVYIQGGIEYCVVVRTNSLNYRLWIAQMNELDVSGTNRVVSKQPHLGVLFKSQNNKTWNAVQSQDMKFTLYKASFSTTSATLALQNSFVGDEVIAENGTTEVYGRRLQPNPLKLTNSSTTVKVTHVDHGMYSTSNNVTITGVTSGITTTLNGPITATANTLTLTSSTNFEASNDSSLCYVKIGNEVLKGTLDSSAKTISSLTRGTDTGYGAAVGHANGATVELFQLFKTPLSEINKTHTAIGNIGIDSYTITISTAPTVSGSSTEVDAGGISITATENYRFEEIKTNLSTLELPNTTITGELKKTTATSPSGSETSFVTDTSFSSVPLGENFKFTTTSMVASNINETNELASTKSFQLNLPMTTTDTNVSPIVDTDRLSAILIANRINNIDSSSDVFPTTDFNPSTDPFGDDNVAIYITKKIALENPATSIRCFFAGHKKTTADIKVLFKILRSDQSDDFDDIGYTFFNTTGIPDNTVPASLDIQDFQEYSYTAGVTDDDIGDPLPEFSQFAIKIVMQATDAANPPRVKDLRVLALAT